MQFDSPHSATAFPAQRRPSADVAHRLSQLILGCVHREYPNHLVHAVLGDQEIQPPRVLTPVFFGSYDWHSAVHGHWSLIRLRRLFPDAEWATDIDQALSLSFTREKVQAEVEYQSGSHRAGFERPYGLAWLLQLCAELREMTDAPAVIWRETLEPLEALAVRRLSAWLPKVPYPIRSGEHSQTAFAMGLCLDWARTANDAAFETLLIDRAIAWYGSDRDAPTDYEPSGHDFLSPALAEADLMRRVWLSDQFGVWLAGFLPEPGDWPTPVRSPDPSDGKLAHLDGLNLSRAWMLEGIASALPEGDPRRKSLIDHAEDHARVGLASVTGEHYAGSHWLGSFAVYLLTGRGLQLQGTGERPGEGTQ